MKTCCFVPCDTYREIQKNKSLQKRLYSELEKLYLQSNVTHFVSGMTLGFDLLCAEIVLSLKKKYPDITLSIVIPFENQAAIWTESERDRYFTIGSMCDNEYLLQYRYDDKCLVRHLVYMIKHSDLVFMCDTNKCPEIQMAKLYATGTHKPIQQFNVDRYCKKEWWKKKMSKKLGENLRFYRTSKTDYSQTDIARMLYMDRSTYSHYELGNSEPSIDTLKNLSRILNVNVDTLVNYERNEFIN